MLARVVAKVEIPGNSPRKADGAEQRKSAAPTHDADHRDHQGWRDGGREPRRRMREALRESTTGARYPIAHRARRGRDGARLAEAHQDARGDKRIEPAREACRERPERPKNSENREHLARPEPVAEIPIHDLQKGVTKAERG